MKNYKRQIEDLELLLMRRSLERNMHFQDSRAFQKLSIVLGCIIVLLIVYILT